jgi:subtilase family serine protease
MENLIEGGTPATIVSVSYELPELLYGYAVEVLWSNLLEEGAAEGKTIFVAAGDNGVSADRSTISADGLFVNGLADTAYNVSVGGTDFYDTALGQSAKYWNAANGPMGGSATSYVPEIPWNNGCAGTVIAWFLGTTPMKLCNVPNPGFLQNGVGGSGSQSEYYTKPDWQLTSVLGVPNDGLRDQPDVSLFAANGLWSHFYLYCNSDPTTGGSPCDYVKNPFGSAAGGTSFGSPAFAGIAALVQETYQYGGSTIVPLGNFAPVLYKIAKAQFSTPLGVSTCDSSLGKSIGRGCVFNYVTAGDINEPCYAGTPNCYTNADSTAGIGLLRTTVAGKAQFAYYAHPGYSLATGLGTVNVTNLLYNYYIGL